MPQLHLDIEEEIENRRHSEFRKTRRPQKATEQSEAKQVASQCLSHSNGFSFVQSLGYLMYNEVLVCEESFPVKSQSSWIKPK